MDCPSRRHPESFTRDCLMEYTKWSGLDRIIHMKTGKEIELVQVIRHPDYVKETLKNDICLIKE